MHSVVLSLLFAASVVSVSPTLPAELLQEQLSELEHIIGTGQSRNFVGIFGAVPSPQAVKEAKELIRKLNGNKYKVEEARLALEQIVGNVSVYNGEKFGHSCVVTIEKSSISPTGYKFIDIVPLDGKKRPFWGLVFEIGALAVALITTYASHAA
ncbi:unnamed protein product [Caenorhabditis sp. 36 PRJEB53466]|nr:unnamed protein product [Caenorhabditis sp. 36 PRJEB53466]